MRTPLKCRRKLRTCRQAMAAEPTIIAAKSKITSTIATSRERRESFIEKTSSHLGLQVPCDRSLTSQARQPLLDRLTQKVLDRLKQKGQVERLFHHRPDTGGDRQRI